MEKIPDLVFTSKGISSIVINNRWMAKESFSMENRNVIRQEKINEIIARMSQVIVGKEEVIRLTLTALLARGHVLIEDVPGVGKTMLVKSLTQSLDCQFKRIQFTPDLLPADITGVSIYHPETFQFEFHKGPIFGNIVLADEINRTPPK